MRGIDLNKPILYEGASLRHFKEKEHHVSRCCKSDVLVLVFEGILRFSEDGVKYEIHPGEYYIQKRGGIQRGDEPSDAPKYLYIHFKAEWKNGGDVLPVRGVYSTNLLYPLLTELDRKYHQKDFMIAQITKFYEILLILKNSQNIQTPARNIADFISRQYLNNITLEQLCEEFHFSKNHIINIFKKEYGKTPIEYMNELKISKAESLLEITSEEIEAIAYKSGFANYSHFYRLFYRKNKISPKDWRIKKRLN